MNNPSDNSPTEKQPKVAAGITARILTVAFFIVLQAVILFVAAGRLNWTWAWVYLGLSLGYVLVNGVIMLHTSLETIAERGKPGETKDWDKISNKPAQPMRSL